MESTEDRSNHNWSLTRRQARKRRLQAEAAMWAIMVVVVDELRQDPPQVALAYRNEVVEALPAGEARLCSYADGVCLAPIRSHLYSTSWERRPASSAGSTESH